MDPSSGVLAWRGVAWRRTVVLSLIPGYSLPFKLNQHRRYRIPRQKHKVTNWREYDASLRQGGVVSVVEMAWSARLRRNDGCLAQAARSTGMGLASFSPSVYHPSTFRMVIWPDAISAQNSRAEVSAYGSTGSKS